MAAFNDKEILSVGELSARSGVAISAIHFYESKGLLRSHRNKANQRQFHRRELRFLSYIKVAQMIGLTLDEIKDAFKAIENKDEIRGNDWIKLAKSWDDVLAKKLELIQRMKAQLGLCIGCGCLSLKDCPLRNPNDELYQQGVGPRLLITD